MADTEETGPWNDYAPQPNPSEGGGPWDEYAPQINQPIAPSKVQRDETPLAQSDNDYYGPYLGWMSALGSGMAKGEAALPGLPGTVGSLLQAGSKKAGEALGYTPPERSMADRFLSYLPTSAQTTEAAKPYVPALQQEATTPGQKIAETVGEFAVTPGPAGKEKTATRALDEASNLAKQFTKEAVIPGAASELAGQATEGTALEPFARIAGAMVPGAATSAAGRVGRAINPAGMERNIAAAREAGVDLPAFAAMESPLGGQSAAALQALPIVGAPITEAGIRASEQLGEAANRVHGQLGSTTPVQAGSAAELGIKNWIKGPAATQLEAAFKNLEDTVPAASQTPLRNLQIERDAIVNARRKARLPNEESGATALISRAFEDPTPMDFEGARRLRTEIGNHLDNLYRLPGDVNEGELKTLYSALTKDLESAARQAGGVEGVRSFREANRMTNIIRGQQNRLAKIIGVREGQFAPEKILENINKLALTGTKGDINRLMLARRSMSPRDWEHVSGGIVGQLGRDNAGNFSADRFVTGYNKLSAQGRDALFGPPGNRVRDSLETIGHLSDQLARVGRHTNVSKTAHVGAYLAALSGMLSNPLTLLPKAVGAYGLARVLSSPATAPYAAGLARALSAAAQKVASPELAMKAPAVRAAYSAYVNSLQNATGESRPERAKGGRIGKPDYPAKRLTLAARRAHREIADESRPLMDMPDEHIAEALHRAKS